jgi:hypothetical protein
MPATTQRRNHLPQATKCYPVPGRHGSHSRLYERPQQLEPTNARLNRLGSPWFGTLSSSKPTMFPSETMPPPSTTRQDPTSQGHQIPSNMSWLQELHRKPRPLYRLHGKITDTMAYEPAIDGTQATSNHKDGKQLTRDDR